MVRVPWEQRETAISSGFDPASLTERSARRRVGDAGLGRVIIVPVYLRRSTPTEPDASQVGLLVRMHPGGGLSVDGRLLPADGGGESRFWTAVRRSTGDPEAIARRGRLDSRRRPARERCGSNVRQPGPSRTLTGSHVCRVRRARPESVRSRRTRRWSAWQHRFLGRLDGLDGTSSADLWGRLALEVVTVRRPERLADTRSLRWHACWGRGGFSAGSDGMATGSAGHEMLLDLTQKQVTVHRRPFRVRTLPDWEREQAAHDLRLSPRRLMAWPVSSLPDVLSRSSTTSRRRPWPTALADAASGRPAPE